MRFTKRHPGNEEPLDRTLPATRHCHVLLEGTLFRVTHCTTWRSRDRYLYLVIRYLAPHTGKRGVSKFDAPYSPHYLHLQDYLISGHLLCIHKQLITSLRSLIYVEFTNLLLQTGMYSTEMCLGGSREWQHLCTLH